MPDIAEDVLRFWLDECGPESWFLKDEALDRAIRERFGAVRDELADDLDMALDWAKTPRRALAAAIVLDQFSRNLFRGDPRSFEADPLARDLAREAVIRGFHLDKTIPEGSAIFFVLPFEHSESEADQDWSMALARLVGNEEFVRFAEAHRDIVLRFGRFPHRNAVLGRDSTAEELAFLKEPGSSF